MPTQFSGIAFASTANLYFISTYQRSRSTAALSPLWSPAHHLPLPLHHRLKSARPLTATAAHRGAHAAVAELVASCVYPRSRGQQQRHSRHKVFRQRCQAGAKPPPPGDRAGSDGESVDIDELAAQLSAAANKLWVELGSSSGEDDVDSYPTDWGGLKPDEAALDEDTLESGYTSGGSTLPNGNTLHPDDQAPPDSIGEFRRRLSLREGGGRSDGGLSPPAGFGLESPAREAEILAGLGDGGFQSQDFEVLRQLGRLSIQQVTVDGSGLNPLQAPRAEERQVATIIAFAARYYSSMPFEDPATVFLKEFLPGTRPVALNELCTLIHLQGTLPLRKWHAARAPTSDQLPFIPLLGFFVAEQSESGASVAGSVPADRQLKMDAIWLVFKWEGLQPMSVYPGAEQQLPVFFWAQGSDGQLRARCRMLRAITSGALKALSFCHKRGVAHGSLGGGSFLLSHCDDRRPEQLLVKLDNFGYARRLEGTAGGDDIVEDPPTLEFDHPLRAAQREDLSALAVTLLEVVFSSLSSAGPGGASSADALQRLLFDVFQRDLREFRQYCDQESDWEAAVALLDDGEEAGWKLLEDLFSGSQSAAELLSSPFLRLKP